MNKILVLLFVGSSFALNAQSFENQFLGLPQNESGAPHSIFSLNSSYDISSNALNGPFIKSVLYTDSISGAAKNAVLPHLQKNNAFGGYLANSAFFSWKAKKSDLFFYVNLASRIQYSASFDADAYKLLFFGNEQYAGKSAVLDGFQYDQVSYQTLQFGMYKYFKSRSGNDFLLGGGIALVSGASYAHVQIQRGALYTSQEGDSVALDANMSSKFVTAANNLTDVNGWGASLHLFGILSLSSKDQLRFQVADLGFVNWFHNNSSFAINQKLSYTGVNVSANSGQFTSSDYHLFFDSVATSFTNGNKSGSFTSWLPFQASLLYVRKLDSTFYANLGAQYIDANMPLPELCLSVDKYFFRKKLLVNLGVSAMGYGGYGINLGIGYQFGKHLMLGVGSRHTEGLLPIDNTFGQSYYANLKWFGF